MGKRQPIYIASQELNVSRDNLIRWLCQENLIKDCILWTLILQNSEQMGPAILSLMAGKYDNSETPDWIYIFENYNYFILAKSCFDLYDFFPPKKY